MLPPATCQIEELEGVPGVSASLAMLREVSLAADEHELFASFSQQFRASCVTHLMSLLMKGCEPGSFRVMLRQHLSGEPVSPQRLREEMSRYHLPLGDTPIEQSAVLSRLVAGATPKIARSVDPADDAVLGELLDAPSDVLAIPVYADGNVNEYAIMCMPPEPTPVDGAGLAAGIGSVNLMSRCIETLVVKNEIERLHTKLDAQMNEIGRVQRSLLPASWPDDPRFTFAVSYEPSEAAGGDYYDYRTFPHPAGTGDELLGVVIADVSGHGPVASVVMSVFRTAMLATRLYTTDPTRTVPDVNTMVCESVEPGMFVTAFLLTIDPATGEAIYACCGHNPPRLRRASGDVEAIKGCGGPPFGILPDLEPVGDAFVMQPGDTLVLYTDGITEAFSPSNELFGERRLDAAIASASNDPDDIKRAILDAVEAHTGARPRDDDQTLVIVRYNGPGDASA
ncbi:MAG: PP2C family protein-serine/threonine phosphatase [Planctomycetota bacterium]